MKLLGRHDNVIEMYGCCTLSPPICLIMEFASGGNLLDYLRSLKVHIIAILCCMELIFNILNHLHAAQRRMLFYI